MGPWPDKWSIHPLGPQTRRAGRASGIDLSRHSPDARGFEAKIVLLDDFGNGKSRPMCLGGV
jgi:hypothetical protein